MPTPEAETLFLDSLAKSRERFGAALAALRAGRLNLADINLDTGRPSRPGGYALADETRAELLKRQRQRQAANGRSGGASGRLRPDRQLPAARGIT